MTGAIDHLWIRVADVEASKRFYETIAPHARIGLGTDTPERAVQRRAGLLLGLAGDHPTENLHMAFPANENQAVDDFHQAALEAGYRDDGAPGRAPRVSRGLLRGVRAGPRRNSIELVNHNR